MPFPLLAFALTLQTVIDQPEGVVRLVTHKVIRGYSLCASFSDPFPGDAPAYRLGRVVPRMLRVQDGRRSLARGAVVLVADRRGGKVGIFDPRGGGNEGCVPASAIAVQPTPAAAFGDWSGVWERIPAKGKVPAALTISRRFDTRSVSGPYFGFAIRQPHGPMMTLEDLGDRDCPIRLVLLGGYLIASDRVGPQCGAEVRGLAGVYRRNPAIPVEPTVEVRDLHEPVGAGFTADAPDIPVPLSRAPAPTVALSAVAGIDDYPPGALFRQRLQGISRLAITVGPTGFATACRASGAGEELDAAACRRVRYRARFTPALDLNGKAVSAVVHWTIAWRIPPRWHGDEIPQAPIP
jgi:hypothetical protein